MIQRAGQLLEQSRQMDETNEVEALEMHLSGLSRLRLPESWAFHT
jgi:hypothetical protein